MADTTGSPHGDAQTQGGQREGAGWEDEGPGIGSLFAGPAFAEVCTDLARSRAAGMAWPAILARAASHWLADEETDLPLPIPALLYVAFRTVAAYEEACRLKPQQKDLEELSLREFYQTGEGI